MIWDVLQSNTVGTTEINACGEMSSTLRSSLMQVVSVKQETPSLGGSSSLVKWFLGVIALDVLSSLSVFYIYQYVCT